MDTPQSPPTMREALTLQAQACHRLGSPQYATLVEKLIGDYDRRGPIYSLFENRPERPVHDALPLRLLGAVHRIALRGDAYHLAQRYQSCGGDGQPIDLADFLQVLTQFPEEIATALGAQVQTNEVGRSAVLACGFAHIARETKTPLRLLEIGASAGLNQNWEHYFFDNGSTSLGTKNSPLVFDDVWCADPSRRPSLSGLTDIISRSACDYSPIDACDSAGRERLLSFVWPDQGKRFERLQTALNIAQEYPPIVERAEASTWIQQKLAENLHLETPLTTVIYHSIVWQYLSTSTKNDLRAAMSDFATNLHPDNNLAWLRMESAGALADLQLTLWKGAVAVPQNSTLLTSSYHGDQITLFST